MDREYGAQDALAFVRRVDFAPSEVAFDAAMQKRAVSGEVSAGRRDPRDRRRDARLRLHGEGARQRLPDARLHGLAAAAEAEARLDRRAGRSGCRRGRSPLRLRALGDRLEGARRRPRGRAVRQQRTERPSRRAHARRRAGGKARHLREAARPRCERVVRDLARRGSRGCRPHVRVQLPVCSGRPPRPADARGGGARRDPSLPRPLSPGLGGDCRRGVAVRQGRRRLGRARGSRSARRRPGALPGR